MANKLLLALLGILITEEDETEEEARQIEIRRHPPAEPFRYSGASGMPPVAPPAGLDTFQTDAFQNDTFQ